MPTDSIISANKFLSIQFIINNRSGDRNFIVIQTTVDSQIQKE